MAGPARCRTERIVAPTAICPPAESNGSEPGAAISARADLAWCRHCRWSNAAGAAGVSPPAPDRIRNSR